jgi:type VI secretion system protein ImpH
MGSTSRRSTLAVVRALAKRATAFDFFQAVRVLESHLSGRGADASTATGRATVGHDAEPGDETIRFGVAPSLGFPVGPVQSVTLGGETDQAHMRVNFMGAVGPAGVMPQHYTELVIQRAYLRDESLRDFLDIFHHRTISLFYRAWLKYRFPFAYERARTTGDGRRRKNDTFTTALESLVGMGTAHLRGRSAALDRTWTFFAGHFARQPRTAVGLEGVLGEYLGVPVRVDQFAGRWLTLVERDRTRLARDPSTAQHNRLGQGLVLGSKVYDLQSKLDVNVGPVGAEYLRQLAPASPGLERLDAIVRSYLGDDLDYQVFVRLDPAEVQPIRLGVRPGEEPRQLGRDTWLMTPGIPVHAPEVSILDSSTQKDSPLLAAG